MPRAYVKGSARVAQRLRVLAHLSVNPDQPIREASRVLGVPETTIRSIKKRWGAEGLATGSVSAHSGSGRPRSKGRRWRRCVPISKVPE